MTTTASPKVRPCAVAADPHIDAAAYVGQCVLCWLYEFNASARAAFGGDPATVRAPTCTRPGPAARPLARPAAAMAPPPAGFRPPCPHEGPVATHGQAETCHIRHCLHPKADWDLCTRGSNNGTVQSCQRCSLHPVLRLRFVHGLGDATNFAHMIPLYTRRGYTVEVECRPDEECVFRAGGARIVADESAEHPWGHAPMDALPAWPKPWTRNKNGWNLFDGNPLPRLAGDPAELWREYCQVRLDFAPQVTDADRAVADLLLDGARSPLIVMHQRGFDWDNDTRSYPDELTVDLWRRLLEQTGGTIMVLDRDMRAARINACRVGYFVFYQPGQLFEVIRRADVLVGIDSGPLNFARFTDTPAVGLWGIHYPSDYLLPREGTVHVVAATHTWEEAGREHRREHAGRDRYERGPWNTVLCPGEGPASDFVARQVLRILAGPRYLRGRDQVARDVQLQSFVDRCDSDFRSDFGHRVDRHESFDRVLRFLASRDRPVIVETGTIRSEEDWAGAGFSTYLFGAFLQQHGGELHSVDLTPEYVRFAREWTRQFGCVTVYEAHSHQLLESWWGRPIDLLYCDSCDTDIPGFQECCLGEVQRALPKLAPDARILIDDTPPRPGGGWQGKGGLAVPWLLERGWEIDWSGWQVLLRSPIDA